MHHQDLARATERLIEQQRGIYDFNRMFRSVTKTKIHLDHADFTNRTKISETSYGGRGLFARSSIKIGDLVIVEKAFAIPNIYGGHVLNDMVMYNVNNDNILERAHSELFLQLVQKLYDSPTKNERFWNLFSGQYHRTGKEGELIDGIPVVDV